MPYATIPKDLTKVKSKVLFNLTKRQLVCFSAGLLVGVPLFFLTKEPLGNSTAALLMILTMLPAFLLHCTKRTDSIWKSSSAIWFGCCSCGQRSGPTEPTISMPCWHGRTN